MSEVTSEQVFKNLYKFLDTLTYSNEVLAISNAIRVIVDVDCQFVNNLIDDVKSYAEQQQAEKIEKLNKLYAIARKEANIMREDVVKRNELPDAITEEEKSVSEEYIPSDKYERKEFFNNLILKLREKYSKFNDEFYAYIADKTGATVSTVRTYLSIKRNKIPSIKFIDAIRNIVESSNKEAI